MRKHPMVIYGPQVKSPSRLSEAILPIRIYYSLMPMDTSERGF